MLVGAFPGVCLQGLAVQLLVEAVQLLLGAVPGVCLQELVSTDEAVLGGTTGTGKYWLAVLERIRQKEGGKGG